MSKNKIVISGINIFEGGPLTIFHDTLMDFSNRNNFNIVALVHDKTLFDNFKNTSIIFLEFKLSRKSYIFRFFFEYVYFYFLSLHLKPLYWISLHDISPNVIAKYKIVYLHNATAFAKNNFNYLFLQPKIFFFSLFYKYLYKINLKTNTYIIVQQCWFKKIITNNFHIDTKKILVAYPILGSNFSKKIFQSNNFIFIYPSLPRVFKNYELICESAVRLIRNDYHNFKLIITIDGSENRYSKNIYKKYKKYNNIHFVGILNKTQLNDLYNQANVLLFPSKIESWGLPLSEFMFFKKPIFCSDLPYANETLQNYKYCSFFNPNSINELYVLMKDAIDNKFNFKITPQNYKDEKIYYSWSLLFNEIFKNNYDEV